MIYDRWWGPRDMISNGFGQRRREGGRGSFREGLIHIRSLPVVANSCIIII